jgi:uncharacterized membrane protein
MESFFGFVRTTLKGALLVLAPMAIALYIAERLLSAVRGGLIKLSGWLPESVPFRALLTGLAILLVCFVIGLFLRTRAGKAVTEWLETHIFSRIPGFGMVRSLVQQIGGVENARGFAPVLAEMEGGFVIAFQVEEYDNGFVTLFIPGSPSSASGTVFLYPTSMVHPINVSFFHAMRAVARWGSGSGPLLTALGSTPEGAAVLERIRTREP